MKLSRLADYRGKIRKLSVPELRYTVEEMLGKIVGDVQSDDPGLAEEQQDILAHQERILADISALNDEMELYKDRLDDLVREYEVPLLEETYQRYEETLTDSPEYVFDRHTFNTLIYRPDVIEHYKSRIKTYSSWKYPGMYIRPEMGEYVDEMINCDPLYLVDIDDHMFTVVKQRWKPEFQSRLRYSTVRKEAPYFKDLPENQFGLIVATDYFNYLPLEVMKDYLNEIFDLLRPGGVFVFTYNNCEFYSAVKNAENGLYAYTPGRLLQTIIGGLGYEIIQAVDYDDTNVSWLEIKKPGEIETLRGGQALAQIKDSRLDN
jgi:SAM-dependent methyltransferase